MDNRLRETAVKVAVWASTQHIVGDVWFGGTRTSKGATADGALDITVVLLDNDQQVQVRKSGRQTSRANWEADIESAVRQRHTLKVLSAPPFGIERQATRIFSRSDASTTEIRCNSMRAEPVSADVTQDLKDVRGEFENVRTL